MKACTDCFAYRVKKDENGEIVSEGCEALIKLFCCEESCNFYISKKDKLEKDKRLAERSLISNGG